MINIRSRILAVLVATLWTGVASAASITDTIFVDGKEWAQVDLFTNLSWNDMNTVCPGGVCGAGTLNGYDMLGWAWASTDQVNALFNHYIGSPQMGPGPDTYEEYPQPPFYEPVPGGGAFAAAFHDDGWRPTLYANISNLIWPATIGLLSDSATRVGGMFEAVDVGGDAHTDMDASEYFAQFHGGWFLRNDVPAPATLPSIILALAALGWTRRKA